MDAMATPRGGPYYNEQAPGIEVALTDQHGLYSQQLAVSDKEVIGSHGPGYDITSHEASRGNKKKKRLIIAGISCALVIVVVVVGVLAGVLTRRPAQPNSSSTGTPTNPARPPNMTGSSTTAAKYLYPTPISWGYPHLEVLALTTNTTDSVYRKYRNVNATSVMDWNPSGQDFELVGGAVDFPRSIAVRARPQSNNTNLFLTGEDHGIYHKYHTSNEAWSGSPDGWALLGTRRAAVSAPAVVPFFNDGTIDIFMLENDTHTTIHHQRWASSSGWGDVNDLGGGDMLFTPCAVSWDSNRIDVFGVGASSNHLLHTYWDGNSWASFDGGTSSFEDLGGFCTSTPVVVSRKNGTLDVFERGGDGGLWHLWYDESWSKWSLISGNTSIQAQPDVISWDSNRLDVFAWGMDNAMLYKSFNVTTGQWTPSDGFDRIGTGLSGPPRSVSDGPGSMHVFAYGLYGAVIWKSWNESSGGSWPTGDFVTLGTPVF
jgi:hypothetical protein